MPCINANGCTAHVCCLACDRHNELVKCRVNHLLCLAQFAFNDGKTWRIYGTGKTVLEGFGCRIRLELTADGNAQNLDQVVEAV